MTDNSAFVGLTIPKFTGKNYDQWSLIMENLLKAHEFWDVVEKGVGTETTDFAAFKARKLIDLKAKNILFQAIDWGTLDSILCKDTSKDIWDSMKKKGVGSKRMKKAQL